MLTGYKMDLNHSQLADLSCVVFSSSKKLYFQSLFSSFYYSHIPLHFFRLARLPADANTHPVRTVQQDCPPRSQI